MNEEIINHINTSFSKEERGLVVKELEKITLDDMMANSETNLFNTKMSVLELSKGEISKVKNFVTSAKKDFRDVIMWASEK